MVSPSLIFSSPGREGGQGVCSAGGDAESSGNVHEPEWQQCRKPVFHCDCESDSTAKMRNAMALTTMARSSLIWSPILDSNDQDETAENYEWVKKWGYLWLKIVIALLFPEPLASSLRDLHFLKSSIPLKPKQSKMLLLFWQKPRKYNHVCKSPELQCASSATKYLTWKPIW